MLTLACSPEDLITSEVEDVGIDPTLVYTHTIHLNGLDEDVKVHKTPERIWLEREPGVFVDYSDALETDRQVYRQRFGALAPDLYDELLRADDGEVFTVGIVYESPNTHELALDSNMRDDSEALAVARAIDVVPVIETIEAKGLTIHYAARYLRHITAEGRADQILALAHSERITTILRQQPGSVGELSIHPATHHEIVDEYNQPTMAGSYATDIKVGVIEPSLYDHVNDYNCGIRDTHDAFSEATLTYSDPLTLCNPNNPTCGSCDICVDMGYAGPLKGHCVNDHPTRVSSLIANTKGTSPYAAARAHIYLPNEWHVCDGMGGTAQVYDWLLSQGVHTVNASYLGCDGAEADIAVRDNDLFIARAAGNYATATATDAQATCVATANSMCVGATVLDHTLACYSNWKNPWTHSSVPDTNDREEPDVTVVGGDAGSACMGLPANSDEAVSVANEASDTTWVADVGSSYAAPTVTAMAALLREECADANGWTERVLRAIFRTGAHGYNPHGTRYSTPNTDGVDGRDGAGWVSARDLSIFCDPGNNAGEGTFQLDTGDGTTIDGTLGRYDPGTPVENLEPTKSENWRAFTDPGTGRVYHVIKYLSSVPIDARIRATISWDACPAVNSYWTAAARDIDLFLLQVDSVNGDDYTGMWVTGSQSVSDNNEGFDFKVQQADDYLVVAGWAAGTNVGCEGSNTEPFGWALRVLGP